MCQNIMRVMTSKIKEILWASLIIVALVFAYGVVRYVTSYSNSLVYSVPAFSVSADGKVTAVPDVAQFSFSVITEGGTDLANLQKTNTEKTDKVVTFVKGKGVDAKDIKTLQYNIEPRYQYSSCGYVGYTYYMNETAYRDCPPPAIVGYTVTQSVSVKIRDLTKVGDILGGIVDNGANSVSQLSFVVDDPVKYENQAREEAMQKAKEKAIALASAGGFKIGKLLSVDTYLSSPQPAYYGYDGIGAGGGGGAESTVKTLTVEPGSEEVIVNVNLRYEIK
jgi:uncharacterized protein YggE